MYFDGGIKDKKNFVKWAKIIFDILIQLANSIYIKYLVIDLCNLLSDYKLLYFCAQFLFCAKESV